MTQLTVPHVYPVPTLGQRRKELSMIHLCWLGLHEWHGVFDDADRRYCLWCPRTQAHGKRWENLPPNKGFEDGECADEYCDHDGVCCGHRDGACRSEEHTSELQS